MQMGRFWPGTIVDLETEPFSNWLFWFQLRTYLFVLGSVLIRVFGSSFGPKTGFDFFLKLKIEIPLTYNNNLSLPASSIKHDNIQPKLILSNIL